MSALPMFAAQGIPTPSSASSSPSADTTDYEPGPVVEFLRSRTGLFESDTAANIVGTTIQVVLIVAVAAVVARLLRRLVVRFGRSLKDGRGFELATARGGEIGSRTSQRVDAIVNVATSVVSAVVWGIAVVAVLATVGLNVGPLLAGAGILGIALGFGAQEVVGDFLNGFFMLVEDQYAVGDIVDVGDATGVVEYIGLRTTRIRDLTGTLWHVPNGEIRRVGNMSQEWARALLDIGVSYDADLPRAVEVIRETAFGLYESEDEEWSTRILDEPEVWGVEELGDSSILIRLVVKTRPGDQWTVSRELRLRIKAALDTAEIEIPFPQRTVWVRTDATGTATPILGLEDVDGLPDEPEGVEISSQEATRAAEETARSTEADDADEYHEDEVRQAVQEDDESTESGSGQDAGVDVEEETKKDPEADPGGQDADEGRDG